MAKKRAEDAPPSLLWKDTFSDLMKLLRIVVLYVDC